MEVSYKTRPRDLLRFWIYLLKSSIVGKIGLLIWLLSPLLVSCLFSPLLRGINPIAHPLKALEHTGQGSAIGWLIGSATSFVFAAVSNVANFVSITSYGFTVATGSAGSKGASAWVKVRAVEEDAHYIYLREFWHALTIPKDAFPSSAVAQDFFDAAPAYWREAKGIAPPVAPDVSGVWPPAPLAGSSRGEAERPNIT